jgi:6-phosphofructokinase
LIQKFSQVKDLNIQTSKLITNVGGILVHFKLQECKKQGLKVVVTGILKTIDNDIEISGPSTY